MVIRYSIVIAIIDLTDDSVQRFEKSFETDLSFDDDRLLYNNHHVLLENANMLSLFDEEISDYCTNKGIETSSVDIDEFEIASLTDRVDVYFEDQGDQTVSLAPSIKAYVHPKNDALKVPVLYGSAYDSTTIIWSWPDDMNYAHYLIEQPLDTTEQQPTIIATIPMGAKTYAETGLAPGTVYTRRLVNFTSEQTSVPSESVTVKTMPATPVVSSTEYNEVRNYDFTSDDSEREHEDERLTAFHSGVGHSNDLKVYKQMDAGYTQQFRAYYKVSGIRTQRERKYEQVGFRYKACLEAIEDVEEQEGEVTFDVRAYPREWVRLKDYSWTTRPVQVKAKLECDVFLRKPVTSSVRETVSKLSPRFDQEEVSHQPIIPAEPDIPPRVITRKGYWMIPKINTIRNIHILFILDCTGSLLFTTVGRCVDESLGFNLNVTKDGSTLIGNGLLYDAVNETDAVKRSNSGTWKSFTKANIFPSENGEDDDDADDDSAPSYIRKNLNEYLFGANETNTTYSIPWGDGINSNHVNGYSGSVGAVTYIRDQIAGTIKALINYVNGLNETKYTRKCYETPEMGGEEEYVGREKYKATGKERTKLWFGFMGFGSYAVDISNGWIEAKTKNGNSIESGDKYSYKKTKTGIIEKYIGKPWSFTEDNKGTWAGMCLYNGGGSTNKDQTWEPKSAGLDSNRITGSICTGTSYIRQTTNWSAAMRGAKRFVDIHKNQVETTRGPIDDITPAEDFEANGQNMFVSMFFTDGFSNAILSSDSVSTLKTGGGAGVWSSIKYNSYTLVKKQITAYHDIGDSFKEEEIAANIKSYHNDYVNSFDMCIAAVCELNAGELKGTRNRTNIPSGSEFNFNGEQKCYTEYITGGAGISEKYINTITSFLVKDGESDNIIKWNNTVGFGAVISEKIKAKYTSNELVKVDYPVQETRIPGVQGEPEHEDPDPEHRIIDGYNVKLNGFSNNNTVEQYNYDIDDYKIVHIEHEFSPFTFDSSVTPVTYRTEEGRAVILKGNMLFQTNLVDQSVWDIVWPKVQATSLYRSGYNQTIGTIEPNGEEDTFLVRNLHIQDTYAFNDGTEYAPGIGQYEDGWEGSVNVYTDMDKLDTNYYGDDCYLLKKKSLAQGGNPVYIQGYTDAILFDCTRYFEKELNAYDMPRVSLISPVEGPLSTELVNRMNESYTVAQAGGSGEVSHYIKVIKRDEDVFIITDSPVDIATEYNLMNLGDCIVTPLTSTIYAKIDKSFQSPILNYRFNLEDHEASSPLYELLPDAYEYSPFKHIVLLRVFYANNVYITNTENYIEQFGDTPIANTSSNFIDGPSDAALTENLYKWTLREWRDHVDNGWYIDNYLWFMSKKMIKAQKYYDELPGHNLDQFYGIVNNRYSADNPSGKKNLRVQIPAFNIPTTVRDDTVRIYLKITEFSPDDAVVSYKWLNPMPGTDSVTHVNGDYATFSSDSVKYKDVEYTDLLATIAMPTEEVTDGEPLESTYTISKPDSPYTYHTYLLEGHTNNSDVLATRYPTNIDFVDNKCTFNAIYKAIMNATSKWSPRIHNGYYYINQHEYYAYSEFNVQANFETIDKKDYLNVDGYVSIDVLLRRLGTGTEDYSINKTTRAELLIDEDHFIWEDGMGVTLAKFIDGEFYDEWYSYMYTSPVISFPNELTEAGSLNVSVAFSDGSTGVSLKVRSYSIETGDWSPWTSFTNGSVPSVPLGSAYQVRFDMQPTVRSEEAFFEDYLCCYLDWKEDGSESSINVNTITDHISTGPDNASGMYVSKIIDLGCVSTIRLSMFCSSNNNDIENRTRLFIAAHNTDDRYLYDENVDWIEITDTQDIWTEGRYYRYKIVLPSGYKCYWLHKEINTIKTTAVLPYVSGISMTGHYDPQDVTAEFIETQAFSIPSDMQLHEVIDNVMRTISADVRANGFDPTEIEKVTITSSGPVTLEYDPAMEQDYPGSALNGAINAVTVSEEYAIKTYNTPYIFAQNDLYANETIVITGVPEQYAPITLEDADGNPFVRLFDKSDVSLETYNIRSGNYRYMTVIEEYTCDRETKYYELKRNDYEPITLEVHVNTVILNSSTYQTVNHLVIFDTPLKEGDVIHVEYRVARSFIAIVDYDKNTTVIYPYNGYNVPRQQKAKYKVFFETNKKNNKFVADSLSLNPVYRTDYKGFIYLTDDHNEPHHINIWADPLYLKAGGYDSTDISIEVLDIQNNPIINTEVRIDCDFGILTIDSNKTDMNGVVHLVYESSYIPATDTLRARVLKDDGSELTAQINITSV